MNGTLDEKFLKDLGKMVKKLREAQKVSTRDFANEVGIDPTTLYRIETGQSNPQITTVAAMAQALGVTVDQLIGWKGA